MTRVFLEGEKIFLRGLEVADVEGDYQFWFDDEIVGKFTTHHRFPYSKESLRDYVLRVNSSKNQLVLAIIDKKTKKHIGNISLQAIDFIARSAEYAIVLGNRDFWGRGVAFDASKLIVNHGFNALNLHRIYLGTSAKNVGMQKLAEKLGFLKEGVLRDANFNDGKFVDGFVYGLLKDDWKF